MPLITLQSAKGYGFGKFVAAASTANSYESIATSVITGNTASVTFSSIPGTYKILQIRYFARFTLTSDTGSPSFQLNGDTNNNYTFRQMYSDGSSAGGGGNTSQSRLSGAQIISDNKSSNMFSGGYIDIHDYASTSKAKSIFSLGGWDANGSGLWNMRSGVWTSTSAITSITLFPTASGDFKQYSHFALYGIKG
jgi:hypothetical protein